MTAKTDREYPYEFTKLQVTDMDNDETKAVLTFKYRGEATVAEGIGNGPIDAVRTCLKQKLGLDVIVLDYSEHALSEGAHARAAAYVHVMDVKSGRSTFGVGTSSNITRASIRALFSGLNRLAK